MPRLKRKRNVSPNSLKHLVPIKKGQILNPKGAGAHDPILKQMRRLSAELLKDVIDMAVSGNIQNLKEIVGDPNSSVLQVGVAKSLYDAAAKGDWSIFERIIERITGKVPIVVDNTSTDGSMNNISVQFVKPKPNE